MNATVRIEMPVTNSRARNSVAAAVLRRWAPHRSPGGDLRSDERLQHSFESGPRSTTGGMLSHRIDRELP